MPRSKLPDPSLPKEKSFPESRKNGSLDGRADMPAMALHEQIRMYVLRNIMDGSWASGYRLPSEHDFVAQFGVSRMTVSKALCDLANSGRIVRVAGVGTFVAEAKAQSTLLQIANIANEVHARGHDYRYVCMSKKREAAASDIAAKLDIQPGASVFHVLCLHLENELPVQLEDRYVSPRMAPDFFNQDFDRIPPSEYLVNTVPVDQIEHIVDAVLPTRGEAKRLEMEAGAPCLLLTRRTWFKESPVTWVRCLHPASRYRLGSRFKPGQQ